MSLDFDLYRKAVWLDTNEEFTQCVFSCNITHNLVSMAEAAGVYMCLWRPNEIGYAAAGDVIEELQLGLNSLKSDPSHYSRYNPPNGWGSYDGLVAAIESIVDACGQYPMAIIKTSR